MGNHWYDFARVAPSDAAELIDQNFAAPLVLPASEAKTAHRALASAGVAGGASYDGMVALATKARLDVLATRDARARTTYESLGLTVMLVPSGPPGEETLSSFS